MKSVEQVSNCAAYQTLDVLRRPGETRTYRVDWLYCNYLELGTRLRTRMRKRRKSRDAKMQLSTYQLAKITSPIKSLAKKGPEYKRFSFSSSPSFIAQFSEMQKWVADSNLYIHHQVCAGKAWKRRQKSRRARWTGCLFDSLIDFDFYNESCFSPLFSEQCVLEALRAFLGKSNSSRVAYPDMEKTLNDMWTGKGKERVQKK